MGEVEVRDWWYTWEVNVRGLSAVTRAFLSLVLKSGEKTVVNMSSMRAHLMEPDASAYQTSKLSVLLLTELMNVDHGPQGLLVYAVHPGGVLTDMVLRIPTEVQHALTDRDTPALSADPIAFLTTERR